MTTPERQIADNVDAIRQQIAEAAQRSGRSAEDVILVAVTKYVSAEEMRPLLAAGCQDFGESRPQHLWEKAAALSAESIRWHLIGHLQRNKVRRTVSLVDLLHSGDSIRLLQAMNQELEQTKRTLRVLLEVNVSGDIEKHGFLAGQVKDALPGLLQLKNLQLCGLMAMSARASDPNTARKDFSRLRELRDQLQCEVGNAADLSELSMGMSRDFVTAIEEGATLVRVGSALFEGVTA
jgi:pyridoxal phosphate enzyme (YggS family)